MWTKVCNYLIFSEAASDLKQPAEWNVQYRKAVLKKMREGKLFFFFFVSREPWRAVVSVEAICELSVVFISDRLFLLLFRLTGIHFKRTVSYRGTCDIWMLVKRSPSILSKKLIQERSCESLVVLAQLDF